MIVLSTATALLIAAHLWGAAPCGSPTVEMATPPNPDFVSWVYPGDCTIYLSATMELWWRLLPSERCTAIVHEWGHLTGHQHSADPRNVMYGDYSKMPTYWRCKTRRGTHGFTAAQWATPG